MMRSIVLASLSLAPLLHAAPSTTSSPSATSPLVSTDAARLATALETISVDNLRADVFFLASDELAGRDTPSVGLRVAARFLRARLERLGWKPGAKDGYFHHWTMEGRRALDEQASGAVLKFGDRERKLVFAKDYYFHARGLGEGERSAAMIVCGRGAKTDFDGKKVEGRWAVCLESDIGSRERERNARDAGAVGLVIVPDPARQPQDLDAEFAVELQRLRQGTSIGGRRRDDVPPLPTIHVRAEAFADLAPATWTDGQVLAAELAETRKLAPPSELENVCGYWPGSDRVLAKELIIVSAHYDHIGVTRDGEINNGADDNGSGTATLLAVAEALADYGPLTRSVMLMWVSGEEKGLLGSKAWTENPWTPDECRVICDINIDMVGRNAPDKLLITPTRARPEYNGLVKLAEKLAPLEGFPALGSADEYWGRSDHMNFATKLKIPVTFLFSDVHEDYHKPGDDPEKLDYDKVRRVSRLVFRMLESMQEPGLDLK